ncbi:MAG: hypothetical protein KJ645_00395, partial [Planctomycetes bacterium]|nr:hypothetical protein [Planctomycetota bacterium]
MFRIVGGHGLWFLVVLSGLITISSVGFAEEECVVPSVRTYAVSYPGDLRESQIGPPLLVDFDSEESPISRDRTIRIFRKPNLDGVKNEGEAAGSMTRRTSKTRFTPWIQGRPIEAPFEHGGYQPQIGKNSGSKATTAEWGTDRHVRDWNLDGREIHPTVVTDSEGILYMAWQDNALAKDTIELYVSEDYGESWTPLGVLHDPGADLKEPCLATGEGNQNKLVLAYIVDDGVTMPVPEVAVSPLGEFDFSFYSIPVWSWEGYAKPVIWTDDLDHSVWYVYLTCEGIYDSAADNINVCSWRATNFGAAWGNELCVYGGSDTDAWRDPDGSYGTSDNGVYLICYNDTTNALSYSESQDYAATYSTPVTIKTMTTEPANPVDPEIEA